MRVIAILFLAVLINQRLYSQQLTEALDLDFSNYNTCSWNWLAGQSSCTISKTPDFLNIKIRKMPFGPQPEMSFVLSKQITLATAIKRPIHVQLQAINKTNRNLILMVNGFDKNQNIVQQQKVTLSRTEEWSEMALHINPKGLKAFDIAITYDGNEERDQEIVLKEILIDGHESDIQKLLLQNEADNGRNLLQRGVIPVDSWSTFPIDNIPGFNDNLQLVGLGECTHGSLSITESRNELLKQLIIQKKCSFVLLEFSFDEVLLYDLYVQGLVSDSSMVKEHLDNKVFAAATSYFDLFEWIKDFNSQSGRKVRLIGLDNHFSSPSYALMDIFSSVLPEDLADRFLKEAGHSNYQAVLSLCKNSRELREKLGDTSYNLLVHVLANNESSLSSDDFHNDRDERMFQRTIRLHSEFFQPGELWCILAHTKHLQKNLLYKKGQLNHTLGSLIQSTSKKHYYVIDFSFGLGDFVQDSCSMNRITIDSINQLPTNSFSYSAMKTPYDQFLYPTKKIDDDIFLALSINRFSFKRTNFEFTSFKNNFDAVFFQKKSIAFRNFEMSPMVSIMKFNSKKDRQYYKYLKRFII